MEHIQVELSEVQRSNLLKLASYLLNRNWDRYGGSRFNMGYFYKRAAHGPLCYDCGTVACALGHGPAAGIPFDCWDESGNPLWCQYSNKNFTGDSNTLWAYLFSCKWEYIDNTPQGAATRIITFLVHGVLVEALERLNKIR